MSDFAPDAPPVMLTIAGSDCSAGAGIQADLKSAHAMGAYALTAVTCIVSEIPGLVRRVDPVDPAMIIDQASLLLDSFPVGAIKTGMLWSAEIIRAVAGLLAASPRKIPLVVDPVMIASSGDALMREDALQALENDLLPLATLVTPNMDEMSAMLGRGVETRQDLLEATRELAGRLGIAVLGKGGHLPGTGDREDFLVEADGTLHEWSSPTVVGVDAHGTGCSLSSAIAARLAAGDALPVAVARARAFIGAAIRGHHYWPEPVPVAALDHGVGWGEG